MLNILCFLCFDFWTFLNCINYIKKKKCFDLEKSAFLLLENKLRYCFQ